MYMHLLIELFRIRTYVLNNVILSEDSIMVSNINYDLVLHLVKANRCPFSVYKT